MRPNICHTKKDVLFLSVPRDESLPPGFSKLFLTDKSIAKVLA